MEEKSGRCVLLALILHVSLFKFVVHSGLNFIDLMVRQGNIDNPPKTPLVPGFECSGIVEALGDSVKGYEVMFWLMTEEVIPIWNLLRSEKMRQKMFARTCVC